MKFYWIGYMRFNGIICPSSRTGWLEDDEIDGKAIIEFSGREAERAFLTGTRRLSLVKEPGHFFLMESEI